MRIAIGYRSRYKSLPCLLGLKVTVIGPDGRDAAAGPPTGARSFQLINIPARRSERSKMRSPSCPTEDGESATETRRTGATARGGRRRVLRGRRVSGYLPLRATAALDRKVARMEFQPRCPERKAARRRGRPNRDRGRGRGWCVRIVQALTRGQRVGRNVNSRVRRGHASRHNTSHVHVHDTVSHSARNVVL